MDGIISKSISTPSIISPHPGAGLTSLPDDVLLLVISLIGVEDILSLRMVCTHVFDSAQSVPPDL
jgi:F-box domain